MEPGVSKSITFNRLGKYHLLPSGRAPGIWEGTLNFDQQKGGNTKIVILKGGTKNYHLSNFILRLY